MKAAILTQLNAPLTVAGVVVPNLNYGQVQVRILVSGICGAQLGEIRGEKGNGGFLPHLLGHEAAAIVERIGEGVTRVKVGDKVVCHWRKGDGIDAAFPRYEWWRVGRATKRFAQSNALRSGARSISIGSGKVATLCEQAICSENRLTPVPMDTPVELCALLGCGLSTALGTVERDAGVKFGESVLIVGTGGLGVNLIRACRMVHAAPIVAVDIHAHKKKLALALGAHRYIDSSREKLEGGYDVIIDTAGRGDSMEKTLPMLNPSGRFIMVGQPTPGRTIGILNANHLFGGEGKMIKATQGGGFNPSVDIPRYLRMYEAGALSIEGIVTRRFQLDQINSALDLVRNGEAGRVLIEF